MIIYIVHLYLQLAELLGFSQLDMIQQLLAHRQELVAGALDNTALLMKKGDLPPPMHAHIQSHDCIHVIIRV